MIGQSMPTLPHRGRISTAAVASTPGTAPIFWMSSR
jgi:hypothetical protein